MTNLRYDVHVTPMQRLAGDTLKPPDGGVAVWSPLSSTLVYGPTEAVLVDPPITRAQGEAVAGWVAAHDRRLTAIYITHAHGDHWFATTSIIERFPEATVIATREVIAGMNQATPGGRPTPFWETIFPNQIGGTPVVAQPVGAAGLSIDGVPLVPVPVGHSDTDNSTVLHVPALDLVVAGDVIYNRVHQYLAESAGGGLDAWLAAIDQVAALDPRIVVAGHKNPDRPDDPSIIDDTRAYLSATAEVLATNPNRRTYFEQMIARFPEWLNPTIAWLSAVRRIAE